MAETPDELDDELFEKAILIVPPGWWDKEPLAPEDLDALKAAIGALPRPPGLGPPGSTFELTSEKDTTTD
jgi:hypothetical protein